MPRANTSIKKLGTRWASLRAYSQVSAYLSRPLHKSPSSRYEVRSSAHWARVVRTRSLSREPSEKTIKLSFSSK